MNTTAPDQPVPQTARPLGSYRYYDLLLAIFIVCLLISNLVAQKVCRIGPFNVGGGNLLFPVTYVFGDVFTEVYGYAASRKAIWIGFFANGLMALMCAIIIWLPASPDWLAKNPDVQKAFETVFGQVPRIVVASLVAYWCGEFANSFAMAKMKIWTKGRMLWSRTIGSTVVGQFVDTLVFDVIAFGGSMPWSGVANLFGFSYSFKVLWEVLATPFTYAVVNFLKRSEGIDTYDYKTDFNPFHVGSK